MAMKLVKKTAEYSIYQRGDERYAVKGADKKAINGDEKVRILLEEELVKAPVPAKPVVEEAAEEEPVVAEAEAEAEPEAEEPAAEEEPEAEAPAAEAEAAEEAPAEEDTK